MAVIIDGITATEQCVLLKEVYENKIYWWGEYDEFIFFSRIIFLVCTKMRHELAEGSPAPIPSGS